jgi:plastocyanin
VKRVVLTGMLVGGLCLIGAAAADETKVRGSVGPGYTISLKDAQGAQVAQLPAGETEIEIEDLSEEHNFHLTGPGVDVSTEVVSTGPTKFRVTLRDGKYTFICDPHPTRMNGSFTVGAVAGEPPPAPPPTQPTAPKPSAPIGAKLVLTSGPASSITLKTQAGRPVTLLRPGTYTVIVRDRSSSHNARLRGAGVSKATSVATTGTQTWRLTLRKGVLTFVCDPHRSSMRGTVKIA